MRDSDEYIRNITRLYSAKISVEIITALNANAEFMREKMISEEIILKVMAVAMAGTLFSAYSANPELRIKIEEALEFLESK